MAKPTKLTEQAVAYAQRQVRTARDEVVAARRANLAQRIGAAQMTKEHGDELRPAAEAPRVAFGAVLADQAFELGAREMFAKELTEEMCVA